MTGDVTVLGLKPDTCILADIGMDVPHGRVVVVPADRALRSRDLNLSINQGFLFRLNTGLPGVLTANPLLPEVQALRERVQQLEGENHTLREKLSLIDVGSTQQAKLDAILALLQAAPMARGPILAASPGVVLPGVVEEAPPPFIPSKIRSDDLQPHIQTETIEGDASVSNAAARLREMRRSQQ